MKNDTQRVRMITPPSSWRERVVSNTPDLPTNISDFRGFDSSTTLNLRGEIPRPKGDLPEGLSQAMLLGQC